MLYESGQAISYESTRSISLRERGKNMRSNIDISNLRTNSKLTLDLKMSPLLEGVLFFFVKLAKSVAN